MVQARATRRGFLRGAVGAVAAPYVITSTALGGEGRPPASERVVTGYLGVGPRGLLNVREQLSCPEAQVVAEHRRVFTRDHSSPGQIVDDWRHYLAVAGFVRRMTASNDPSWRPITIETSEEEVETLAIEVGDEVFLWVCNHGEAPAEGIEVVMRGQFSKEYKPTQYDTLTGEPIETSGVASTNRDTDLVLSNLALGAGSDAAIVLTSQTQ